MNTKSKPRIFGIFAHPDDESFPISGTIAKYALGGIADVFIYTMTRGEASRNAALNGQTPEEIAAVREVEVKRASAILGVREHYQGNFPDSRLRDLDPRELENEIERHVLEVQPQALLTFEVHGGSVHPDHIVVHHAVKRVFVSLREKHDWLKRLCFHCLPLERIKDWPRKLAGNPAHRIHAVIDVAGYQAIERSAIYAHQSVIRDVDEYNFENWMFWDEEHFAFFQESFSPPVDDLLFGL